MNSFIRDRRIGLVEVLLIMMLTSLVQTLLSFTMTIGALGHFLPKGLSIVVGAPIGIRFSLVAAMIVLWVWKRTQRLIQVVVIANALFTLALLSHTQALIATLFGFDSQAIGALMLDVVLMLVSKILIFSIWYWIIDPPGVRGICSADEPWEFLFPQRGSTLPLTRRAKMPMLMQSAISVVTLTGIAGEAINILDGSK